LVLGAAAVGRGVRVQWARSTIPATALLGFLGIALHQWLQATGLITATATATSWIVATVPVFVAILSWAVLGEPMGARRIAGMFIASAGVLVLLSAGDLGNLLRGRFGTVGDGLIGLSALNWAIFTVLSKRTLMRSSTVQGQTYDRQDASLATMFKVMAAGWLMTLLWGIVAGGWRDLGQLSLQGWAALLYLGVACSGLAYLFWYQALGVIDAAHAGAYLYIEPFVTTVFASMLLGEVITIATGVGGIAILAGVWLVGSR
jgi:drug/metabolite transporter (DMT)-like permease